MMIVIVKFIDAFYNGNKSNPSFLFNLLLINTIIY